MSVMLVKNALLATLRPTIEPFIFSGPSTKNTFTYSSQTSTHNYQIPIDIVKNTNVFVSVSVSAEVLSGFITVYHETNNNQRVEIASVMLSEGETAQLSGSFVSEGGQTSIMIAHQDGVLAAGSGPWEIRGE